MRPMRSVDGWPRSSSSSWAERADKHSTERVRPADIFDGVCGIVGYVGNRSVRELLLDGLKKLEYRGYDSAGISVIGEDRIETVRAVGNLDALRAKLDGLAHARAGEEADGPVAV